MRRIRPIIFCAFVLAVVGTVAAQDKPKPGPGHDKLGYFLGNWKSEGDVKESPFGPAGKFSTKDHCDWFDGKFAVVCHSDGKGPTGPTKSIGILGYNGEEKVYTYYGVGNDGMTMMSIPRGTVQGDTWTYDDESMMGGKTMKSRYVIKQLSPTSYTFKWMMEGKSTKM